MGKVTIVRKKIILSNIVQSDRRRAMMSANEVTFDVRFSPPLLLQSQF